jgi:hypothetical protein
MVRIQAGRMDHAWGAHIMLYETEGSQIGLTIMVVKIKFRFPLLIFIINSKI